MTTFVVNECTINTSEHTTCIVMIRALNTYSSIRLTYSLRGGFVNQPRLFDDIDHFVAIEAEEIAILEKNNYYWSIVVFRNATKEKREINIWSVYWTRIAHLGQLRNELLDCGSRLLVVCSRCSNCSSGEGEDDTEDDEETNHDWKAVVNHVKMGKKWGAQ